MQRESKKLATRQRISDLATELFFARGFDAVTVDEIAVAAKVSKMTVFNYFARKEELILDREDDLRLLPLCQAVESSHGTGQPAIAMLRKAVQDMSSQKHPLCFLNAHRVHWWRVVSASPALRARLRELDEEAAEAIAASWAMNKPDAQSRLRAGIVVLTMRIAREEAIRLIEGGASVKKANVAFLGVVETGFSVVERTA